MRTSSAPRKRNVRNLRRTQPTATTGYGARNVRFLVAALQEAEIRARIKLARKEAGLSQTDLAELLEVIPRTVQNYENDHVPWTRIKDIAEVTGVSTRWLLHGDESAENAGSGTLDHQLGEMNRKLDQMLGLLSVFMETVETAEDVVDEAEEELDARGGDGRPGAAPGRSAASGRGRRKKPGDPPPAR